MLKFNKEITVSILLIVTRFLPLLITIIQLLEKMFPAAGIGPFKLSMAVKILTLLKPYLSVGTVPLDELLLKVPDLISQIVPDMNKVPVTWNSPIGAVDVAVEPK